MEKETRTEEIYPDEVVIDLKLLMSTNAVFFVAGIGFGIILMHFIN